MVVVVDPERDADGRRMRIAKTQVGHRIEDDRTAPERHGAAPVESRNRYVDLLRAIAITCVVLGHWTMAAPWIRDGHAAIEHLLTIAPWTRWLTWCFRVMPVFFFVGGCSNGTSWRSAQRREVSYGDWFASRLQRLLGPTLVLVAFWVVGSMIALPLGVHPDFVRVGSQISLIPTWFLAVYILVCMVVPWTHAWWKRSGYTSVAVLVAGAIVLPFIGCVIAGFGPLGALEARLRGATSAG